MITLNVIFNNGDRIRFTIYNTKKYTSFGNVDWNSSNKNMIFKSSNGLTLCSDRYPQFIKLDGKQWLFAQGREPAKDNYEISVNVEEWKQIIEAVGEYNAWNEKQRLLDELCNLFGCKSEIIRNLVVKLIKEI